jgi:hypothetical protein
MKSKKTEPTIVSEDLSQFLEKMVGVPKGKARAAAIWQSGKDKKGNPIKPLGVWFGGCYYSRHSTSTGGHYYVREYCVA